ncbi:MAG TPA: DUF5117 domain-containing protein, partial [Longimicrobiales bacterium]|nr:DUF5117 domain-containing protein [Longimicrobiales bacterium]
MRAPLRALLLASIILLAPAAAEAQQRDTARQSVAARTEGMRRIDGFVPLYWDERTGRMLMEVPAPDTEILYYVSLPQGVGHNDIGLNRGDLGPRYVVTFERVGPKVLMVQPNQAFRATTDNAAELKAVEDAFARSTIWGFTVAAESDGRVLVDATDFFLRDAHGVINTLRGSGQGTFRVDATRGAFYMERTKG